ncbi:MAG: hypothetical protein AAFP70_00380 [Calditrichota bacterium]
MVLVKKMNTVVIALAAAALFLTSACSSHPNEEQIRAMEEARSAALSAEQKVADCNSEKSALDNKLSSTQAELQRVKDEKAAMMERLASWQGE